jgi:hypothetical protein
MLALWLWDDARKLAKGNERVLSAIAMFHSHFAECLERRSFNDTALPVREDVINVFSKLFGLIGERPVVEVHVAGQPPAELEGSIERSFAAIAEKFGVNMTLTYPGKTL